MCGLAGILGNGIIQKDIQILEELSYICGLRGMDSTGIFQANIRNKNILAYTHEKMANDIGYFTWRHKESSGGNKSVFRGVFNTFFGVHVRAATIGAVVHENAHPFMFENLVGMHNGTLHDREFFDISKTDSEMMFAKMNESGVEETLSELNEKSAYAIVTVDMHTGEVTFARNKFRPLFFCVHETRNVMYWASEEWMLRGIMKRHNEPIKGGLVYWFKEDTIYRINPDELDNKKDNYFVQKTLVKKVLPPAPVIHSVPRITNVKEKGKEKGKNIVKGSKKIPSVFCCSCSKQMTLLQQYYGKRFSSSAIVCEDCDSLPWSIGTSFGKHMMN